MTPPIEPQPESRDTPASRLRDIETVADAALSRLDERSLLETLLERVKKVLQADTAAVLLLDPSARQLVATAASGIEEEVVQGVRVPLGTGFAGRVAASREPVILTRVDHTTVRNPLLVDRGIKSLLGVPLFVGGKVIGVLHVGSLTGRPFDQQDAELLQLAADRAALAVHSMTAQADALAAAALHRSLMPTELPAIPGVDLAARYVTGSGNVGGDWYDVFVLPDGKLGVVVGDVAGSGLAAAVIMGRMRSALRAYVLETRDPAAALRKLDRKIQYFEPDAMATVLYGVYTPGTGEFVMSSAGHLPPVLAAPGAAAEPMSVRPDPPIGTADDPARHTTASVMPPGALLLFFTDGLVERRDQPIDRGIGLVAAALDDMLAVAADRDGRDVPLGEDACAAVMRSLVGNAAPRDDIAILALHRHA
ncbi:MAG TPA: GAF domain-containing SpoIIE family protein phosphatase [Trebonia sp.]|nr:GAF domain-containing SpoIIE family protein phosphatase [Trebonia sp.]